jgi:Leucine-rich repeat (LRR) protein
MTEGLKLQAGGPLRPRHDIYIERPEDEILLKLLLSQEYVNILSPRQMGKSSLMVRTIGKLNGAGVRTANIDIAADFAGTTDPEKWFLALTRSIASKLGLTLDVSSWWRDHLDDALGQRFQRFFREIVCEQIPISAPIVVFLDEIDNTLSYPFTDALFTAIRGMYNERGLDARYQRVTFCLIGVATPNELIKDRRTTSYNIGRTLALRDFDDARDDLRALCDAVASEPAVGRAMVDRVLYWTGGQPLLTIKFCAALAELAVKSVDDVDSYADKTFHNLNELRSDIHFQQVLRFVEMRFSAPLATLRLYRRILNGEKIRAETTAAHLELELSGLVKRDENGNLVRRNRIYTRLFDNNWLKSLKAIRVASRYQRIAVVAAAVALLSVGGWVFPAFQALLLEPTIKAERDRLNAVNVELSGATQSGLRIATRVSDPNSNADKSGRIWEEVRKFPLPLKAYVSDLRITSGGPPSAIFDLMEFRNLESLDFEQFNLTNIEPLANLTKLRSLDVSYNPISDLSPLRKLTGLTRLEFWQTSVEDLRPLSGLVNLTYLSIGPNQITNIDPIASLKKLEVLLLYQIRATNFDVLKNLTNLTRLRLRFVEFKDLSIVQNLTKLETLEIYSTSTIGTLEPLSGLANLTFLGLGGFQDRVPGARNLEPLSKLIKLTTLALYNIRGVADLEPLAKLVNMRQLSLADMPEITSLDPLQSLNKLESVRITNAPRITSLQALQRLSSLQRIDLTGATGIANLEPLSGLSGLQSLNLAGATGITSLEPLRGLSGLQSLNLAGATGITSLEPLRGLSGLQSLDLTGATGITSLEPLRGLSGLQSLDLTGATGITSLEPLRGLRGLQSLNLAGATGITSLEPLRGLSGLQSLDLTGATGITSVEPLAGLTQLRALDLTRATGITSLKPLRGKNIDIQGASRELLATMQ